MGEWVKGGGGEREMLLIFKGGHKRAHTYKETRSLSLSRAHNTQPAYIYSHRVEEHAHQEDHFHQHVYVRA